MTILKVIVLVVGIPFLTFTYLIFLKKQYYLINGFESACKTGRKTAAEILSITKNTVLKGFTLPKIVWVQENEPEIWAEVKHILLPKDYPRFWLEGKLNIDYSDGASTLLFDMDNKVWSQEILNIFNVSRDVLPDLVESVKYVGDISIGADGLLFTPYIVRKRTPYIDSVILGDHLLDLILHIQLITLQEQLLKE